MLFRFELKKMLFTRRGIWILLICLILKTAFLFAFPKLTDDRIRLSRKQYDKCLNMVLGESSDEKNQYLIGEYEHCKEIIDARDMMQERYRTGELAEGEWQKYCREYDQAKLYCNALEILHEKAEQFCETEEGADPSFPKPWYIDEYGWQTVFNLLRFPDVFLLVFLLLAAVRVFASEDASGMLPVLMSAAKGRKELFLCKTAALVFVVFSSALLGGLLEFLVFYIRGFLADGGVPLYSVTVFSRTWYNISLLEGYLQCLLVRCIILTAYGLLILGISVWVRSAGNLIMLSLMLLTIPFFFLTSRMALFTYPVLLSGTQMLKLSAGYDIPVRIPVITLTLCSVLAVMLGMMRYTEE